ncbi:NADH dehydrogenase [ubiquinone] 1 alpha subcomplex subunit 2 isoform X1 [Plutella xylostella]|uniref:NADH dehydrogenase [ubiquinone] 1 alpha subcomplex subunit 2 isoform X1 n=1 Tax=Plutella xylostella TaxID=51655 RepID=UPI0005D075A8|nr:NADH dehydrogenase [ubiquinone] 1 alpha subcomplex subunit 2 isoform X1 [Plutella xylostella]
MSGIRLGGALKELRIHLCQTSKQSAGVREFIQQHYVNIKKENPYFPILIRECSGVQPKVYARFEKGQEVSQPLHDFSCEEVYDTIREISKITPSNCNKQW